MIGNQNVYQCENVRELVCFQIVYNLFDDPLPLCSSKRKKNNFAIFSFFFLAISMRINNGVT